MQPNAATGGLFTLLFFFAFSGQSLLSLPQSSQTLMALLLTNILAFSNVFPQSIPISNLLPFAQYLFPVSYLLLNTYFQSLTFYAIPISNLLPIVCRYPQSLTFFYLYASRPALSSILYLCLSWLLSFCHCKGTIVCAHTKGFTNFFGLGGYVFDLGQEICVRTQIIWRGLLPALRPPGL